MMMQNDVKQVDRQCMADITDKPHIKAAALGGELDDMPSAQILVAYRIAAEAAKDAEIAGLKHDLDRYMTIANAEVNESAALRKEVAVLQARVAELERAASNIIDHTERYKGQDRFTIAKWQIDALEAAQAPTKVVYRSNCP